MRSDFSLKTSQAGHVNILGIPWSLVVKGDSPKAEGSAIIVDEPGES